MAAHEGGVSATSKKLNDLRVVDLRIELEKRNLDKNGIKVVLVERLRKVNKAKKGPNNSFLVQNFVTVETGC